MNNKKEILKQALAGNIPERILSPTYHYSYPEELKTHLANGGTKEEFETEHSVRLFGFDVPLDTVIQQTSSRRLASKAIGVIVTSGFEDNNLRVEHFKPPIAGFILDAWDYIKNANHG